MYVFNCFCRTSNAIPINFSLYHIFGQFIQPDALERKKVTFYDTSISTHGRGGKYTFFQITVRLHCDPEFLLTTTLPQKEKPDVYIPTVEEVNSILQTAKSINTDLYISILLASHLGLRRSEICALEWSDFDWKNKTLEISKALCLDDKNQYVLKAPKSYSGYRKIPIPDTVASALDEYRKENDTVISITPNSLTTRFHRLLVKMNMPHFTFHNLRHYNASIMLALNIPNKYAMEFMGHATDNLYFENLSTTATTFSKKWRIRFGVFKFAPSGAEDGT